MQRTRTRLVKLAKHIRYWSVALVSHSATIRTWPITKNGDGSE
jgi:hypothetical protein